MAFVVNAVNRGISTTIGLVSEKRYDHQDRKAALALQKSQIATSYHDDAQGDPAITDEQERALDDAADGSSRGSSERINRRDEPLRTIEELVRDSLRASTIVAPPYKPPRLPHPIIIPQRRPGTKTRGFARAYPPDLEVFGIEQEAFLGFLKNFQNASQASGVLYALFISAAVAGNFPNTLQLGVSLAVQLVIGTAIELQQRYKANSFLDRMNKELFMPRGLYALVLVYNPDESAESGSPAVGIETFNLETAKTISEWGLPELSSSLSGASSDHTSPESSFPKRLRPIRGSDGSTKGEAMMPFEVAPLVYPGLDKALLSPDAVQNETFKQRMSRNKKFVQQYFDRRATAEYTGNNPSTALSSAASTTTFRSRFADPNHPVNNGTTVSLLTGGKHGHIEPGTVGYRETGEDGRLKPENKPEPTEKARLKDVRGPIGLVSYGIGSSLRGVKKVLGSNVMYLAIVNMPSEEEMAEARTILEKDKKEVDEMLKEGIRAQEEYSWS